MSIKQRIAATAGTAVLALGGLIFVAPAAHADSGEYVCAWLVHVQDQVQALVCQGNGETGPGHITGNVGGSVFCTRFFPSGGGGIYAGVSADGCS
ncbi:hypothetical protein [Streptomyces sp. RKAG293]|uniref:hypothetical protein n=1 Tax=Streptomyces sp. RKAG293 TaxID=2893403 RepID=UPI002033BC4A|nr:hypothetical protein [Streptomyces sp. RKAG293]MCM2424259.1 hypothetical protein [Streptomyces sp. RKAG293]